MSVCVDVCVNVCLCVNINCTHENMHINITVLVFNVH